MPTAIPLAPVVRRNFWPAVGTAALLAVLILLLRFDQLLDRSPPIQFYGGEVIPPAAGRGETIQLVRFAAVNRPCPGTTYRQIRDAKGYIHILDATPTLSVSALPSGGQERLVGRTFALPASIALGEAKFRASIVYVCPWLGIPNPLHRIWPVRVHLPDLTFTVREKGSPQ